MSGGRARSVGASSHGSLSVQLLALESPARGSRWRRRARPLRRAGDSCRCLRRRHKPWSADQRSLLLRAITATSLSPSGAPTCVRSSPPSSSIAWRARSTLPAVGRCGAAPRCVAPAAFVSAASACLSSSWSCCGLWPRAALLSSPAPSPRSRRGAVPLIPARAWAAGMVVPIVAAACASCQNYALPTYAHTSLTHLVV